MTRDEQQELLRQLLGDCCREADRVVQRWLEEEIDGGAVPRLLLREGVQARLAEAVRLGREIAACFSVEFNDLYYREDHDTPGPGGECRGCSYIRRGLRRCLGCWTQPLVEAVLNRILDRRSHLLNCCRRKYQPSLLAPQTFDPRRVRGYLIRVAGVESRHVPAADLRGLRARTLSPELLADSGGAAADQDLDLQGYRRLAARLKAFWSRENGFRLEHKLEALTSLGLGTPAEAWLERRLPAWQEERTHLNERARQLLLRREVLQEELEQVEEPRQATDLRNRLDRVERQLGRLQEQRARHAARLRPRPAEVQQLLAGVVPQKVGALRHQRARLEVALFERRVLLGKARLLAGLAERLAADMKALLTDVEDHLKQRPPSSGAHKLGAAEKASRLRGEADWHAGARRLLDRIREQARLAADPGRAADDRADLLGWLADAEDLYEFGILAPKPGLFPALGRRFGARLERLLRVESRQAAEPGPKQGSRQQQAPGERPEGKPVGSGGG